MMDFEFFIARRYLFSKRKVKFVSVINFVSILGITVGAAALLVIMSVFNGFTGVVSNVLVSFDPHLRIEKKGGLSLVEMQRIEGQLRANKNVRAFSPFVSGKALIFSIKNYASEVKSLAVVTRKINTISPLFYERLGFVKTNFMLAEYDADETQGYECLIAD